MSDPWAGALIWYLKNLESTTDLWRQGLVKKREPGLTSNQWKFHISPTDGRDDDDDDVDDDVELMTDSLDLHHLEYKHIKRRDKDLIQNYVNISDMTFLSYLNEPEMIECLRLRYSHHNIYTNIGPILVALNPFEIVTSEIYSVETIKTYFQRNSNLFSTSHTSLPPHVYTISSNAYQKMFLEKFDYNKRENQSILVNGESGAGKTESTKQILRYLSLHSTELTKALSSSSSSSSLSSSLSSSSSLSNSISTSISTSHSAALSSTSSSSPLSTSTSQLKLDQGQEKNYELLINAMNPITESFGNAKTSRNNNSSRFDKWRGELILGMTL
jgi:myosin heavy subunit